MVGQMRNSTKAARNGRQYSQPRRLSARRRRRRSSELLAPSAEVGAGRAAPLGGARPSVVVIDRLLRRAGDHIGLGLASRSSIRATKAFQPSRGSVRRAHTFCMVLPKYVLKSLPEPVNQAGGS